MVERAEWGSLRREASGFGERKEEVIVQLTRLDSATCNYALSTPKRLQVALEASELGIRGAARKESVSQITVRRVIRDVSAVYVYLSEETLEDPDVLKRVEKLRQIDEELSAMAEMIENPEVAKTLRKVPHVGELFAGYFHYRTVQPLLDPLKMPYSREQSRSVDRYLKANTVEKSLRGLSQLALRYVFAEWLNGNGVTIDGKVAKAAEFVLTESCSALPGRTRWQIESMRIFLLKIMDVEYKSMGSGVYARPEDLTMFPKDYSGTIENAAEAYRRFGKAKYCPAALKQFAGWVVNEVPWSERMEILGYYKNYSDDRLYRINCAGMKFLEDALIWPGNKPRWQMLMVDTEKVLKEAKRKMLEGSVKNENSQI